MSKKNFLTNLPPRPGVYKFKDKWGNIIYVGASKNLKKRVSSYFHKKQDHLRLINLVNSIFNVEYEIIDNIYDVFIRERALIGLHKPKYNIRWLDDKQYPFLMITKNETYPRLQIVREKLKDENLYFGRQTQVKPLRKSLNKLRTLFPICDCKSKVTPSKKTRPCLNYDLKLCPGPCASKISEKSYNKTVMDLERFLQGDTQSIINNWEEQMKKNSEFQNFEEAAKIRDRLKVYKQLTTNRIDEDLFHFDAIGIKLQKDFGVVVKLKIIHEKVVDTQEYFILDSIDEDKENILFESLKEIYHEENNFPSLILLPSVLREQELLFDWLNFKSNKNIKLQVFSNPNDSKWTMLAGKTANKSYFRHFKNKNDSKKDPAKYLETENLLKNILNTTLSIKYISCIDISTLQGSATVAAIVSFKEGIPDKSNYRRFSLENIKKPDDVGSMKQVLTRYFQKKIKSAENFPDLLILDGGRAQLSAAYEVFANLGIQIPYFGIAKKEEEIVLPSKKERIKLKRNDPVLQLIVQMRDEAHRFAITYNRLKREKYSLTSELDQINGLGVKRKNSLLKHFSSVKRIKTATIDELSRVPLIHKNLAKNIFDHFHN